MPHEFNSAEELEKKYVHQVYDDIAPGFRHTRYKAWPYVEQFLKTLNTGSIVADVGCGSGKYLGLTLRSFMIGSDSCEKLVEIAHERKHEVSVCNNLKLPYRDGCFDAVISVGVIHHLASTKRRVKALQELGRILRPGGKMLVYVWAMEQTQRKFDAQDVLVPYTGHKGKNKKLMHQQSQDSHFNPSLKLKENNEPSLKRRSRSFDSLLERYQPSESSEQETHIPTNNDDIVPSNAEFRALKELVETLKNKKDYLITNINSKVMKLYPEKEKHFVHDLVSAVVGKLFDRSSTNDVEKCECPESPSQKRRPNIKAFVSQLVKKLFKDKNDEETVDDHDVGEQFSVLTKNDDLQQVDEEALKQSLYESLFAWAREKFTLLSREQQKALTEGVVPREDSCDSECSEVDLESATSCHLTDIHESSERSHFISKNVPVKRIVQRQLASELATSSDTDSDSSSSIDIVNSDSGISDGDSPPNNSNCMQGIGTSSCINPTNETTLQRYYHVFIAKELPDLVEDNVHRVNVLKEYYDHGNWAVIAEKQ